MNNIRQNIKQFLVLNGVNTKNNILANFSASIWNALISLIFVPFYIRFMGIEAYGLIGLFVSLMGIFALLDMGLSTTINREMARLVVQENKAQDMCDLIRTLEIPYWLVGVIISVIVVLASPLIAYHWVSANNLSPDSIHTTVILMGLCAAFQWPMSFYSGAMMGIQQQVLLNGINVIAATIRGLVALLILWLVSPTVEAFFCWQVIITAAHVGSIIFFLWRSLPAGTEKPQFRYKLILTIWRFAGGMTAITIVATILTQLDKVILSRMLSLEMFGHYTLANVAASFLYRFVAPVFTAISPKLTVLVEQRANEKLIKMYHASAQLVTILVLPAALVLACFSKEILLLWTKDPVIANNTYLLMTILVLGTAVHCIYHIPWALQLAYGWTRLAFISNVIAVLILVPLLIFFTERYGPVGAACVWLMLNSGYIFVSLPVMHRRFLSTEKWRWYIEDVGQPLLATAAVVMIGRIVVQSEWNNLSIVVGIGLTSGAALFAAALASNQLEFVTRVKSALALLKQSNK